MVLIGSEELTLQIGALITAMKALPVYKGGNSNFLIKLKSEQMFCTYLLFVIGRCCDYKSKAKHPSPRA